MAPHDTESRTSALGANDYFTGSYGRPSTKPFTTKENDAYPMETPVDIRPTPDSHHGLLSDPTFSSEKGSAKAGGNSIHRVENVRWRPVWLRPVTLSTFLALFIALTIALPVMLWYSQENDGLVRTRQNLVYLWRFGPTATMLSPAILFQSLKRKHYFVFLICFVSLILKIQIVLAPSLYSLAAIRVSEPAEVQVLNSFNTTAPATTYTEGSAYYTAKALVNFDMRFPFGVNGNLAYQTFKFSNGTARGTTSSPLSVDVDGYFSKIECLKMEDYTASAPVVSSFNYHTFNVSLTFPGCDAQVPVISDRILWDKNKTAKGQTTGNWVVTNSVGKPCPNLPQQFNQSLYYAARFGGSTKNASQPDFLNVAAVLCTSTGWVSKVRVVDDGVSPNVTELANVVKTPVTADLWTMLNSAMPEAGGRWGTTGVGMVAGPVDSLSQFRGESLAVAVNVSNPLLYTNEILQFAVLNMSQALGPLLGHYRLRVDDESQLAVTGSTVDSVSKLVVNQWVCWTMAALFALLSLVVASVLLRHTSRTAVWFRDPATILGNMIFFKEHPDLADRVAHTLVMLGVSLYTSCCDFAYRGLAILSCLSTRSCSARDLDVSLMDMLGLRALYLSLRKRVWAVTLSQSLAITCAFLTTLVSVIFTVESIPDSHNIQLQQESWFGSTEIGRGLDGLSLSRSNRQLLSSLVTRQGEASLAYPKNTYDDLVFPVLGGVDTVPVSPNTTITATVPAAKLHPMECFNVPDSEYNINITNWVEETKYYEAIITQPFSCPNGSTAALLNRLDMGVATNRLGVSYMADVFYSPQNTADINMACSLGVNATDYEYASWRYQTYAWGKFSTEKNGFDYFSMWRCNYTWVEATTQVHLAANDGEYVLDPERPPQADLSTIKPWTPTLDIPHVDQQFINIQVGDAYPQLAVADLLAGWIGEQFKALIEPFGKLPLEALGDAGQDEEILQGLQHNYGLVAAQLVNIENRYNLTARSRNAAPPDQLPTLEAVVSDNGRRRLVQNATVTYILVAILVAVALTHISAVLSVVTKRMVGRNWPFHLDVKGLAPDGFHSMATMGALLRGSNASDNLPESTQLLSTDELHGRLSDLNFRLGWFQRALGQARVFTIGVRGDGDFQYLGGKTAKVDDGGTL
ncbi:hypothetical protein COL26b_012819 [Colletotrichum chrysophilum]|uniref:uncharacterized protein n=1 Tax=Colletotrichum chrysophilum TaxID=1836956 RepID=UPI0023013A19|nr:uncharacterized protein COL26b_012819 [Colletotrichum chrysophilum]KAJ0363702.1 hypothetical protein COL26b_012819 [Colletotrichum chrysophilum]